MSVATTTSAAAPSTTPRSQPSDRNWGGTSLLTQILVLTRRLLRAFRDPRLLIFALLQPLIMLTLFSQVFRSIANTPGFPTGVNYIDYLMPAILVTTGSQSAMMAGALLANDLKNGALARFRSLPISMFSILISRSLFDVIRNGAQLTILLVAATLLFGYGPSGGVLGTLAALALALAVGWALSWIFMALAAWIRNMEVMQMVGMVAVFPLMFASSAFVPIDNLPGWLQAIANVNPLTYAIDAARGLALSNVAMGPIIGAVVTSAGIALVGGVIAGRGIRRP